MTAYCGCIFNVKTHQGLRQTSGWWCWWTGGGRDAGQADEKHKHIPTITYESFLTYTLSENNLNSVMLSQQRQGNYDNIWLKHVPSWTDYETMIHRPNTNTNKTDCSFPFLEREQAFAVVSCCSIGHLFLTMSSSTRHSILVLKSYVAKSLGSAEKVSWHHKSVCNSVCYLCQSVMVCGLFLWEGQMINVNYHN